MNIFISGSISIKILDIQVIPLLESIISNNSIVLVGDAFGTDKAVQQYLFQNNYQSVIVYYSTDKVRNNIGNWQTKQINNENHLTGKNLYQLKDTAMAMDADCGLMIWDGKSRGTKYNIENMMKFGKPYTVVENKKIYNK